ncbi:MAG TPA: histidine--tRNA ligase [Polyangiaceae bacterium]|jgi:histidyl-tRNA synthetase
MTQLRAVKGMNDVLPEEIGRWHKVEALYARAMELHGFREVRTPYLEPTPLFARAIGEVTDVVEKEMYSFTHHRDQLTLRPEGTAGAVRAYVEHVVHNREPVSRWYYAGPMFRAERPAKGRYRQFYQLGAEIFGDPGPACDAEMIDLLVTFLRGIGIQDAEVLINSLGGPEARAKYREALTAHLTPKKESLSEESQRRLGTNPLRILDSKDPRDQEAVTGAPSVLDCLTDEDAKHFTALQRHLEALGTPFRVEPRLVRGLDYYTRTLFEIKGAKEKLGAGDTLVGGGRYDGMIEDLGGPKVPAIGFAAGLERLLIASDLPEAGSVVDAYVVPMGEASVGPALLLGRDLRAAGVRTEVDGRGGKVGTLLRRANALGARFALILGDRELAGGVVQVKDLAGHAQEELPRDQVAAKVAERLGANEAT